MDRRSRDSGSDARGREFSATHPYTVPAETVNFELTATVTDQDRVGGVGVATRRHSRTVRPVLRGQKFDDPNANGTRDNGDTVGGMDDRIDRRRHSQVVDDHGW